MRDAAARAACRAIQPGDAFGAKPLEKRRAGDPAPALTEVDGGHLDGEREAV